MSSNNVGKKILSIHVGKKKALLHFEDEVISLSLNTYFQFHLYENKILSEQELKQINKFNEIDKYIEYAKTAISRSYMSEKCLTDKLAKKNVNSGDIAYIIAYLKEKHLLDDEQYGNDLLEYLQSKNFGKNKIIDILYKKGLKASFIKNIDFNDENEIKKAKSLIPSLEKKYSKYNYKNKISHIESALLRNGFETNIIPLIKLNIENIDEEDELNKLKIDYLKATKKYLKKYEKNDANNKVIKYLLAKGYSYKNIIYIKEKTENEN